MTRKEARTKAISYLWGATCESENILSKIAIDDRGTLSEEGYSNEDCDKIKHELECIMRRVFKMELK